MGNRCYVAFPEAEVAVYLHWNGGLESVLTFLDLMNERGLAGESYGAARFCQIVGNFFGGTLSVGVTGYSGENGNSGARALSQEDNGCFVVGSEPVPGERFKTRLTVASWWMDGRKVTADRLAKAMTEARAHDYFTKPNAAGENLLDVVRRLNAIEADKPKAPA